MYNKHIGQKHEIPSNNNQQHTIILIQSDKSPKSRTYYESASIDGAIKNLLKHYEAILKRAKPHIEDIYTNPWEVIKYIEELYDIAALVFNDKDNTYKPHPREWITNKVSKCIKSFTDKQKYFGILS